MVEPTDIFVSYKAEDRDRVCRLVQALQAEGFSVWWDVHIGGGTNWHEEIERHLGAARCVLVAWSKRSIAREGQFVRDEARHAQRRHVYVPLLLDAIAPPLGFGEIQGLALNGWKGDRADPRFQNVIAAVRRILSDEPAAPAHLPAAQPRVSRRALIATGTAAAAVTATGGWFLLRPSPQHSKRIAVLPFANLSGRADQAYFAEGIAEEIRSALSRLGLEVIGRTSSDAVRNLETEAAAKKLRVANILTGSVRRSPAVVRISAQLLDGSDGVQRWAEDYDRAPGDEIGIQTDIATNVAQALSIALGAVGRAALTLGGTSNAAAQDLYLQARELFTSADDEGAVRRSLALLDGAIARDPGYAQAHQLRALQLERLALGYAKNPEDLADKLTQAEAAATRATTIAPQLGAAYSTLASIRADQFNFTSALQNMRKALALSPQEPSVVSPASIFMQYFGDAHRALDLADRSIALDPFRAASHIRRAEALFAMRDYQQSIAANLKALELAPQSLNARRQIGDCLVLLNRSDEARANYGRVLPDDAFRLTGEAIIAARSRNTDGVKRTVARMQALFGAAASYQYAEIYAQALNANGAFAELDEAVRSKDPGIQNLKSDPFLDPIRGDPRYAALLASLNFPVWS